MALQNRRLKSANTNMKTKKILIIIITVNILIRIPALFDPVSYGDECIYLTLGNAFNKGQVFYRDIHDNKPPMLYLTAALAQANLFWFRLITIIANSLNLCLIYLITKKFLKNQKAALLSAIFFAIFSFFPEGRIANAEIYMVLFASLGLFLSLQTKERKKPMPLHHFASGLSFSIAFLYKVPIAFDYLGFLLAFFFFPAKKIKNIFSTLANKNLYLNILGFIVPIALSIIYYSLHGAFTPYVRSALMQNVGYLSSWGGSNLGLYIRALILFALTILLFIFRKKLKFPFYLFALLTAFGLYGVFLSERPYPHYLMEVVPWFAVLAAILLTQKGTKRIIIALLLIFLTFFAVKQYQFWWYPQIPYYKNFLSFISGKKNKQQYFSFFGTQVLTNYKIAKYIKLHTNPNDRVFIWGDAACIYALSDRLPPGRYTVNYHIYDFNGYRETLNAIKNKKPPLIIMLQNAQKDFPQLKNYLAQNYFKINKIDQNQIYKRMPLK